MTLADRMYAQGRRLFAWRSTMPLMLLPLVLLAMPASWDVNARLGGTGRLAVQWLALLVSFAGLGFRCLTVSFAPDGTSSRDTRDVRAPSLNTTGGYSIVRHPLYLGAGLMWLGVAMSLKVWWLVVIVGLAYWLYIERVAIAEEAFLIERFPDQYRQWVAQTPAFIPRLSAWRRSVHPFQAKRLLSEHNGLLAVALSFLLLQFLTDQQHGRQAWGAWSAAHSDLVRLTEFAVLVSVACILVRRSPLMRNAAAAAIPIVPLLIGLLGGSLPSDVFAQPAPLPTSPLTLSAALDRAMTGNPTLLAARARRAIGAAGVAVAGERLNPEGRMEFDRDSPHQAYTVAIPLELGGKRARRVDLAEAATRTAGAEVAQLIAETRNEVRRAYFDRVAAEARLVLLADLQTISARVRDAASARFDAGSAPRLELLQAELALAQAENETTGARGALAAARSQFNALLGLPLETATTLAPADAQIQITFEAAMARARTESAELALIDRRLEEQRARVAVAKSLQTPDITPEAAITHGFGADSEFQTGWKAALAVSIPIFTSHKAGVTLEEATLAQLTAERTAAESRIAGAVAAAIEIADGLRQQYVRYRDQILPQAIQVEAMADDAYRLGQTGIAAYLQALQATRDVRMRALQAEADLVAALADLERAMGAPLQP